MSPPSEPPSHLPPLSIPRLSLSTRSELPASCNKLPLAIYFIYGNVYVSILLFQFVPPSPPPLCPQSRCVHIENICLHLHCYAMLCKVTSVVSNSVQPHRRQPTRLPRPWDSPSKNTGVGCHFLLQCMKVKSESEVAQSCLTLSHPMDCSLPGSSILHCCPANRFISTIFLVSIYMH